MRGKGNDLFQQPGGEPQARGNILSRWLGTPCGDREHAKGRSGLGNISASQADYFQAVKGGGHGDYKLIVYAPYNLQELWDLTILSFDKSDEYRNPAMILADGILGQMMEPFYPTPYVTPHLPRNLGRLQDALGDSPMC